MQSLSSVIQSQTVAAIICGYERGGTTLISEILKQHPDLSAGFEVGFLLADTIADFLQIEPYCTNLKTGWRLDDAALSYICAASSWEEAYNRLYVTSPITQGKSVQLFDKTPKYMENLSSVLAKMPSVPCIVVTRDPRAVLSSWAKRSNLSIETWIDNHLEQACQRYVSYGDGLQAALNRKKLADRILVIKYEELCSNSLDTVLKLFEFIGLEFDLSYIHFNLKNQFPNVYGNSISSEYLSEYKKYFNDRTCCTILELTSKCSDFFWMSEADEQASETSRQIA